MTEELKNLIENAPIKRKGRFENLMIVSNGKYDGFWGENGYNRIILLGHEPMDEQWYKITEQADVFHIINCKELGFFSFNMDIPELYEVPRIWFCGYLIEIDNELNIDTIAGNLVPVKN